MPVDINEYKTCGYCDKKFYRRDYPGLSDHNWKLKRFCNKTCKHKSHIEPWVHESYEQRRERLG